LEAYRQPIADHYGKYRVMSLCSSGYSSSKSKWINSFHFHIWGKGYYKNPQCIPTFGSRGEDLNVYKQIGSQQLFRLPFFSSKQGEDRVFRPVKYEILKGLVFLEESEDIWLKCLVKNIGKEQEIIVKKVVRRLPQSSSQPTIDSNDSNECKECKECGYFH
jgi:hypothetical protein